MKKIYRYLGINGDRKKYEIIDAVEGTTFTVKAADYKQGVCSDVEKCALSRALKRSNKDVLRVYTGLSMAYVVYKSNPDVAIRYQVPESHRDAIDAFDRSGYLAPGTYRFRVVSPSLRLWARVGQSGSDIRTGFVKNIYNKAPMVERSVPKRRLNTSKAADLK